MRYLKALLICIIFALLLIFVWQNKEVLGINLILSLDFGVFDIPQFQMPVYLAIPLAFLLGAVVAVLYGVIYNSKLYGRTRDQKKEIKSLKKQLPPETKSPSITENAGSEAKTEEEKEEEEVKSPIF